MEATMCFNEFRLRNVRLTYPNGKDFAVSPWLPLPLVIGYRLLFTFYCGGWIIYSIISDNTWKWLIYLTDWSFLCVTTYFICSSVISIVYLVDCHDNGTSFGQGPPEERAAPVRHTAPGQSRESLEGLLEEQFYDACENTDQIAALERAQNAVRENADSSTRIHHADYSQTLCHKVAWFFYIIASNNSFMVTIVYWSFLYNGFKIGEPDVAFHLLNSVFMLTETCLSAIPVRLLHVVYAELYGVLYLIFTVVYWRSGGTNTGGDNFIYPILDYEDKPCATAVLIIVYGLAGLPLCQLINFGLFKLRRYLHSLRSSR